MRLQIVLEPSEEGGYTVYVPSLPGCVSEGDTRDQALRNIREAIELYLEPADDDVAGRPGVEVAELRTRQARERLVRLYERWGREEKLAELRAGSGR